LLYTPLEHFQSPKQNLSNFRNFVHVSAQSFQFLSLFNL
jgi:hypothetical protein